MHTRILPLLVSLSVLLCVSCSTPTNVAYFQDAYHLNGMEVQEEQQFSLRPGDKINIIISSSNPMLEKQFTLTVASGSAQSSYGSNVSPVNNVRGGFNTIAYTVDEQGTINFPVLGKISVWGKNRKQVAEYIQDRLIARELIDDPIVTVEYVNMGIDVLGEVSHPGHIDINRDHFTILDALSRAGDLTITGQRENVMVRRQEDGINLVFYIDLTDMQSVLESPAYYLQQNDLVYVAPNDKKKRESRAIGNTLNTPGFWMSLASLSMTVITFVITLSK